MPGSDGHYTNVIFDIKKHVFNIWVREGKSEILPKLLACERTD